MKKLLLVGLLSAAVLTLNSPAAQAGIIKRCLGRDCCKCSMSLCVRPYNAFSPVCCGCLTCMGCCPFTGGMDGGMGCGPMGPPACMPSCFNGCGPSCSSSGCCDTGCLPPAGAVTG